MENYGVNFRSPKVSAHNFAMVPRSDIPRSAFRKTNTHKTTINATYLYPVFCKEVLPGDSWSVNMAAYIRMATPLYPIMDQMVMESFFWFVPNRLTWIHWNRFMGEQESNPADSISYSIPQIQSPVNGFPPYSIYDYLGIPTSNQTAAGNTISINALPLRAYALIYNLWYRDQNLQSAFQYGSAGGANYSNMDDGPDPSTQYRLIEANKKHDYHTSALPWTQKGGVAITVPLGTSATVKAQATPLLSGAQPAAQWLKATSGASLGDSIMRGVSASNGMVDSVTAAAAAAAGGNIYPSNLYADLSTATAATINQLRLAFTTQQFLEKDARGGTRYTEIIRSHFGVVSPDARLMRPEYLGGGQQTVNIAPVPQTTATGLTGGASPLGTLAAVGTLQAGGHGFRQSFTEHGYIMCLVCIRRTMVYQQGIDKMWSRLTRFDFYDPVFANLGEQSILNKEIFSDGSAADALTFGYQERWGEYRWSRSYTSGYFNSKSATPLDSWHLAQNFATLPVLASTFAKDETYIVLQRALAAGAQSLNQQFLCDFYFDMKVARAMPAYSVPGLGRL